MWSDSSILLISNSKSAYSIYGVTLMRFPLKQSAEKKYLYCSSNKYFQFSDEAKLHAALIYTPAK